MLSPQEREHKKGVFGRKSGEQEKKYEELYADFCVSGYTKLLADEYADAFINDAKKVAPGDIIQAARLYDNIHDLKSASFYLSMLEEVKKLSTEERFLFCVENLKNISKLGRWREAEDFRTENIDFLQKYSVKSEMDQRADLYIALSLSDCAAKRYTSAFRLLTGFGYKPKGKNDKKLLEILTTGIYICAKSGDSESLDNAVMNARAALGLFSEFEHEWTKGYYEKCINDAAEGII